jgi:hypothetical protein
MVGQLAGLGVCGWVLVGEDLTDLISGYLANPCASGAEWQCSAFAALMPPKQRTQVIAE